MAELVGYDRITNLQRVRLLNILFTQSADGMIECSGISKDYLCSDPQARDMSGCVGCKAVEKTKEDLPVVVRGKGKIKKY